MRAMVPLRRGGWSLTAESNNKKKSRRRLNQEPQWHGERKSGCRKDKRSPAGQEPDQRSRWEKRKGNGKGGKSCSSGAGRKQVGRYREVTAERSRKPWLDTLRDPGWGPTKFLRLGCDYAAFSLAAPCYPRLLSVPAL